MEKPLPLIGLMLAFSGFAAINCLADSVTFRTDAFAAIPGAADVEEAVFEAVNAERSDRGLPLLAWDAGLAMAARQHSAEMNEKGYFAHESPTPGLEDVTDRVYNAGATDLAVGENLASENNVPATEDAGVIGKSVNDQLMNSPAHRDNILDRRYTHVGVGCAVSAEGTLFCTQVFSKKALVFDKIKIHERTVEALRVDMELNVNDDIGIWLDDADVKVFNPSAGVVTVELLFPLKERARKIAVARRAVGDYGPMTCFLEREFDPRRPFLFRNALTDIDVASESQSREELVMWRVTTEGKVLDSASEVSVADGNNRVRLSRRGDKFELDYDVPAGTGVHELIFVVDNEGTHAVEINTDAPLEKAFRQIGLDDAAAGRE